ncbi:MAG: hypothetical protein CMH48_10305 [Muricauda sp.]|nr:Hsp20/alpha crystallin family protein [Allomuricauda sp.]MAU17076.1 hypothetical protein [Allomuricauda sp.]MBC31225.1 hypothetical protein [Allomuricauda sp.]|tara:strand:+ start:1854 stop:2273 length:420 start_codon:yes stop_codon:yes gene_type:complete
MSLLRSNFPAFSVFNDLFDSDVYRSNVARQNWVPAVNVVENDTDFEIQVAAPGMQKDQFDVSVENGVLTITGNVTEEEEQKEKKFTRKEFAAKSFTRSFTLPENIDDEGIAAKYQNGILLLTLKKKEKEEPKKKQISVS